MTALHRRRNKTDSVASPPPPDPSRWSVLFAGLGNGAVIDTGTPTDPIIFDMPLGACPNYGAITLNCEIIVDQTIDTEFKFASMTVGASGKYTVGTVASPFPRNRIHKITPTGARANEPFLATPWNAGISANRGILVQEGGKLSWIGATVPENIFKLGATANVGDSFIIADRNVTFKAGDRIELSSSKYYTEGLSGNINTAQFIGGARRPGYGREIVTVASDVNNATLIPISQSAKPPAGDTGAYTISPTLQFRHHGRLQYVVAPLYEDIPGTRLSYTQQAIQATDVFGVSQGSNYMGSRVLSSIAAGAPSFLDHRSTGGLLTHPIKFGADPTDPDWINYGYGGHTMVMGQTSERMFQCVEFSYVGQAGILGRYPIHDHVRSVKGFTGTVTVPPSGTILGDLDGTKNFTKQCSVHRSSNRGATIHGTCGTVLQKSVFSDIDTHGIFLEDGSEERNVIDGNFLSGGGGIRFGRDQTAQFTASISGNLMTVTAVASGAILKGQKLFNGSMGYLATIVDFGTATGGTGTYWISASTSLGSQTLFSNFAIKAHDVFTYSIAPADLAGGSSGIWFTNPENYLRNNIVSGFHHGIWNAFSFPYYTGYKERGSRVGTGSISFLNRSQDPVVAGTDGGGTPVAMQAQTITLTCIDATTAGAEIWRRDGSVSGTSFASNITTGVQSSHGSNGSFGGYTYTITPGATRFQVGDTYVFDVKRFFGVFGQSRDVVPTSGNTAWGPAPGWNELALQHFNNEAGCCSHDCMISSPFVIDEAGRTFGPNGHQAIGQRIPSNNGSTGTSNTRFLIEKFNGWKGGYCIYQNESDHPHYLHWTIAGGREKTGTVSGEGASGGISEMIQGAINGSLGGGQPGAFDGCLFSPKTLDDFYPTHKPNIMVSYGGGVDRVNCIFIPQEASTLILEGGATGTRPILVEDGATMRLWDFYVYAINHHFSRDSNNSIIGAGTACGHFGVRSPPVHFMASNYPLTELRAAYNPTFMTNIITGWAQGNSGAFKLPADGSLYQRSGGWQVHNRPFLTYGTTGGIPAQANPGAVNLNGILLSASYEYVGVRPITFNGISMGTNSPAFNFTRMQADGVTPVTNGDWNFGAVVPVSGYTVMKHAAVLSMRTGGTPVQMEIVNGTGWGGIYPPQSALIQVLWGSAGASDHIVLKIKFDHTSVGTISITNGATTLSSFPDAGSLSALLASSVNAKWADTTGDWLYVHLWGAGMTNRYSGDTYNTDRKWQNEWNMTIA